VPKDRGFSRIRRAPYREGLKRSMPTAERLYIYLVYGMHWMLNFSTAGQGKPEGVLIRGILADPDGQRKLLAGPGRVTKYLRIDNKLDGADVICLEADLARGP